MKPSPGIVAVSEEGSGQSLRAARTPRAALPGASALSLREGAKPEAREFSWARPEQGRPARRRGALQGSETPPCDGPAPAYPPRGALNARRCREAAST